LDYLFWTFANIAVKNKYLLYYISYTVFFQEQKNKLRNTKGVGASFAEAVLIFFKKEGIIKNRTCAFCKTVV
jgi:hypothetical protein